MNLTRLMALYQLHLRKSVTQAALAMHITPSAVSQHISMLEDEFGIQLVERQGRSLKLTTAGQDMVLHAGRIIEELQAARASMAHLKETIAGTLTISSFPSAGTAILPAVTNSLAREYPELAVLSRELEPEEGLVALKAWEVDMALVDDVIIEPVPDEKLEVVPLLQDEFVIMLPADHPLAKKQAIPLKALQNEKWVNDAWASNTYTDVVISQCREQGFAPNFIALCKDFTMASSFVRESGAVFMLAGIRRLCACEGVVFRSLEPVLKRSISVVLRRSEHKAPAIQAALEHLKKRADELKSLLS